MFDGVSRGAFVVFEGTEGSGKTTQAALRVASLRADGVTVVATREPGGTAVGEKIRSVLLNPGDCAILAETEALLYAAARAQLVREIVRPALDAGSWVVSDRFSDSSLAYQGGGRGLPIEQVRAIQEVAVGDSRPDLRLLLDLPVAVGLERRFAAAYVNRLDREDRPFHERVRQTFLDLAAADPGGWAVIDAAAEPSAVADRVGREVRARLRQRPPGRLRGAGER